MTTIVDPSGTPVPIYNRSGATIIEITGGPLSPSFNPTPIVRHTGVTIALVAANSTGDFTNVILPDDAEIGDLVEVHSIGPDPANVLIPTSGPFDIVSPLVNHSAVFRKISETDPRPWRQVGA